MSTSTFSTLAAVATLIALAIAVVAFACIVKRGLAERLGLVGRLVTDHALALGAAIATAATLGSLYYSEVADFVPCDYCWYQRIAMYPLVIVLGVAALRRDRGAVYTALPFSVIGLGIAIYHYQLQLFPEQSNACNLFAPCTQQWVDTWGFISIPFMAGAGFLAITMLGVLALRDDRAARRSELEATAATRAGETVDGDLDATSPVVPSGPSTR